MKWIIACSIDAAIIAVWVYLDYVARRGAVIRPVLKLWRCAWWLEEHK